MARKQIPPKIRTQVEIECRRRCAICFGLENDDNRKTGQIAHLDHNNSNNKIDNLAYLCLFHHDEYDTKRSQSSGIKAPEVKHFRQELYDHLAKTRLPQKITEDDIKSTWDSLINGTAPPKNTYRLLAELFEKMTTEEAQAFSNFCNLVWETKDGKFVYYIYTKETNEYIKEKYNLNSYELRKLEKLGLIEKSPLLPLSVSLKADQDQLLLYGTEGHSIIAEGGPAAFEVIPLTDLGKELRTYCNFEWDEVYYQTLFYTLPEAFGLFGNSFNKDPNPIVRELKNQVARKLKKKEEIVTKRDYKKITELGICAENDITDLPLFTNLEKLDITGSPTLDLGILKPLKKLNQIWFSYGTTKNISGLSKLHQVKTLVFDSAPLPDPSSLKSLKHIERISFFPRGRTGTLPDCSALKHLKNLKSFGICKVLPDSLAFLKANKKMESLTVSFSDFDNLDMLKQLNFLKRISIRHTKVTDISILSSFKRLEELDANCVKVKNIRALSKCSSLKELDLESSLVGDISPLKSLISLEKLNLSQTKVTNIDVLNSLTSLRELKIRSTKVKNISVLEGMTQMKRLVFNHTEINDISPLKGMTGLEYLCIDFTQICDISPLNGLKKIKDLLACSLKLKNIDAISTLSDLERLYLRNSEIPSLKPIARLQKLEFLDLSGATVEESKIKEEFKNLRKLTIGAGINNLSFLEKLPKLEHLSIVGSPLTDFSLLKPLKNLQILSVKNVPAKNIEVLSDMKSLKSLTIQKNQKISQKQLLPFRLNNPKMTISMKDNSSGWVQHGEDEVR